MGAFHGALLLSEPRHGKFVTRVDTEDSRYFGWEHLLTRWLAEGAKKLEPARSTWGYRLEDDVLIDGRGRAVAVRAHAALAYYCASAFRRRTWSERSRLEEHGLRPLMPHEFASVLSRAGKFKNPLPELAVLGDDQALEFVGDWVKAQGDIALGRGYSWRGWRLQVDKGGLHCAYPTHGRVERRLVASFVDVWTCELERRVHRRESVLWARDAVYCLIRRAAPAIRLRFRDSPPSPRPVTHTSAPSRPPSYAGFSLFLRRWFAGEMKDGSARARGTYRLENDVLYRKGSPVSARVHGCGYYALESIRERWGLRSVFEAEGFVPLLGFELVALLAQTGAVPPGVAYESWRGDGTVLRLIKSWLQAPPVWEPASIRWRSRRLRFESGCIRLERSGKTERGFDDVASVERGEQGTRLVLHHGKARERAGSWLRDAFYRQAYALGVPVIRGTSTEGPDALP